MHSRPHFRQCSIVVLGSSGSRLYWTIATRRCVSLAPNRSSWRDARNQAEHPCISRSSRTNWSGSNPSASWRLDFRGLELRQLERQARGPSHNILPAPQQEGACHLPSTPKREARAFHSHFGLPLFRMPPYAAIKLEKIEPVHQLLLRRALPFNLTHLSAGPANS